LQVRDIFSKTFLLLPPASLSYQQHRAVLESYQSELAKSILKKSKKRAISIMCFTLSKYISEKVLELSKYQFMNQYVSRRKTVFFSG